MKRKIIGGFLMLVMLFTLTGCISDKETDAWVCAQDMVRNDLKYDSSSAKFCSQSDATITQLDNGKWSITGTVEAKNAFGTYVKKKFNVTFTMTESGYKDGYVMFY